MPLRNRSMLEENASPVCARIDETSGSPPRPCDSAASSRSSSVGAVPASGHVAHAVGADVRHGALDGARRLVEPLVVTPADARAGLAALAAAGDHARGCGRRVCFASSSRSRHHQRHASPGMRPSRSTSYGRMRRARYAAHSQVGVMHRHRQLVDAAARDRVGAPELEQVARHRHRRERGVVAVVDRAVHAAQLEFERELAGGRVHDRDREHHRRRAPPAPSTT